MISAGFPKLYLKDVRILMFQLSGFSSKICAGCDAGNIPAKPWSFQTPARAGVALCLKLDHGT